MLASNARPCLIYVAVSPGPVSISTTVLSPDHHRECTRDHEGDAAQPHRHRRTVNPNRRISETGNCGKHESERLPMRSQGRARQCTPSHTGGPSDALDDSDPAASGQG